MKSAIENINSIQNNNSNVFIGKNLAAINYLNEIFKENPSNLSVKN